MTAHKLHISPDLVLPLDFVVATDGIFASKGMGKSHLAQVAAEELLALGHVVVVIDPTDAWWGLRSSADGKSDGYPIAVFGGDHGDVKLEPDGAAQLAEAVVAERFSCVICTDGLSDSAEIRYVRVFLDTLYRKNREPLHVFVDEADIFAPQKPFEVEDSRSIRTMSHIVRRGRRKGIGSTIITQRPSELNASVRSQVEMLFVLGMLNNLDIDAVEKWLRLRKKKNRDNASFELQEQMIDSLDTLQQGDAWLWAPRMKLHKRFRAREKRTFDSGATPKVGKKLLVAKKLAAVDIQRLGASIAAQVERQKAEDPKVLRARVAELEKQLAKKGTPMPQKVVEHVIEKPAVSKVMVVALERSLDRGDKATTTAATLADKAGAMMQKAAELMAASGLRLETELARLRATIEAVTIEGPTKQSPGNQSARTGATTAAKTTPYVPGGHPTLARRDRKQATPQRREGQEGISTAELRILEACAWAHAIGLAAPEAEVVAFLAGYTVNGHFTNLRGKLHTAGLVEYPSGGTVRLTEAGASAAPQVSRPLTNEELHRAVYERLDNAKRRLLAPLIEAYPNTLSDSELAERGGYTINGHFTNLRGRLRTLGLITYPSAKHARAADLLFPEAS